MRPYDFRASERLSKEQARTLTRVVQTTARLAANQLSSWLHTPVDLEAGAVGETSYSQLLDPTVDDGAISITFTCGDTDRIPEALMTLPRGLVDSLIERLMGGDGKHAAATSTRPLTDFDRAMAMKVGGKLLDTLGEGFEGRLSVGTAMKRAETDRRRLPRNHPPSEHYLKLSFTLQVNGETHPMLVALPEKFLQPLGETESVPAEPDPASVDRCSRLPLLVSAEFAHRDVTLQEMLDLRPGRVLMLDARALQNVVVCVEGEPKFTARPGRLGDRVVVEITSALTEENHAELLG